jgi:hypothetical protein
MARLGHAAADYVALAIDSAPLRVYIECHG